MIYTNKSGDLVRIPSLIVSLSTLFIMLVTILFVGFICLMNKTNKALDTMCQRYDDLVYENEILWTYVENIDTFKSIDDAVIARDKTVYDLIQFIDE